MIGKKIHYDEELISISILNDGSIELALNEEGCKFLIEELQELLQNKSYVCHYDSGTGYDCGVLSKNSLGIAIVRKDF